MYHDVPLEDSSNQPSSPKLTTSKPTPRPGDQSDPNTIVTLKNIDVDFGDLVMLLFKFWWAWALSVLMVSAILVIPVLCIIALVN